MIFSIPFPHASLLHSPPPSLSIGDYTVGKNLHFHSTTLIGSKRVFYPSFKSPPRASLYMSFPELSPEILIKKKEKKR
ncbi:unnamed protein product, partial [Vitis vinifera]